MKKIQRLLLAVALSIISFSVFAESITSDAQIEGTWLLGYTKKSVDAGDKKPMDITWILKSGQLTQQGIAQARGDAYNAAPVAYIIENGHLKIAIPGRAGKFDEYSLETKTDNEMVLKDVKFGTLFYFSKK